MKGGVMTFETLGAMGGGLRGEIDGEREKLMGCEFPAHVEGGKTHTPATERSYSKPNAWMIVDRNNGHGGGH
jgi:hypothetical protein